MGAPADRLNRVLLSLLGLLLLAVGVLGLLPVLGAFGRDRADDRVLAPELERFVADSAAWLWPLVALLLVLLALAALRWLVQQLRTDRVGDLDLTTDRTRGETHLDSGALTEALVASTERCPGVESASARLVRSGGRQRLMLHVRLADRADPAAARQALAEGPLDELRTVLGGLEWPQVQVELEPSTRGSARSVS